MQRRKVFKILAGAALTPLAAQAQQQPMPVIGYLGAGTPSSHGLWTDAFKQRLVELGWIEGSTIQIETRWAEGRRERAAQIASEFVRLKVKVIVASGTEFVIAAKQATSEIPIVFAAAGDPVATGLVVSLARPGGNTTGLSLQTDVAGKRLQLLHEVVPSLHRLAITGNAGSSIAALEIRDVKALASALGLEVVGVDEIKQAEDFAPAIGKLKGRADALYVANDPLVDANRPLIISSALSARLPTMYSNRDHVTAGGLMSYGPSFPDLFRRSGDYVDKILRGAKPADLPVEQPTKFDLAINLITAKVLKVTVPYVLVSGADAVVE